MPAKRKSPLDVTPVVTTAAKDLFQQVNSIMSEFPEATQILNTSQRFIFTQTDSANKKARGQIKSLLQQIWGSGAYNYEFIAKKLRMQDPLEVEALLDEDFIDRNGLYE